ncbi:ATP-binding protein [Metasolibacillus sp. FSL K6-0083]|uniref:sensor histidine kinase n=1 Tax=Metasolibacillus sp. FSL K6-0083 TaxID=2921416 RepID=UPI003159D8C7
MMKLKTKINLFSTLLTLVIMATSFTSIFLVYKQFAFQTEYTQLQNRADELMSTISKVDTSIDISSFLRAYIPSNGALRIVDENDKQLIYMQATTTVERIPFTLEKGADYTISSWKDTPVISMNYPLLWPTGEIVTLELVEPLYGIAQNIALLKWILIAMALIAIVPIYLASSVLAGVIAKPIQQLTTTMQQNIKTNRYEQLPLKENKKDEIAEMTTTYNALMHRLEDNYMKQQQFVGNASHELKTPLTVIESYAKLLQRRGFQNEQVAYEALAAITKETANMQDMITQMLQLASVNETIEINLATTHIEPLLQEITATIQQAYAREVRIQGQNFILTTDAVKLKQLLFIFVDNARKYSEQPIIITMKPTKQIIIQDEGQGIPKKDLPHLFERFYRVDKARSRKTGGTGLGLAIAKELADLLNLDIEVNSTVGVGTTITISAKEVIIRE